MRHLTALQQLATQLKEIWLDRVKQWALLLESNATAMKSNCAVQPLVYAEHFGRITS